MSKGPHLLICSCSAGAQTRLGTRGAPFSGAWHEQKRMCVPGPMATVNGPPGAGVQAAWQEESTGMEYALPAKATQLAQL